MEQFHLADREPVAAAIEAAKGRRSLSQLGIALRQFSGHPASLETPAAQSRRTRNANPLMILCERPEAEDLVTGHPFSGPSGQPMLKAMKLAGLQLSDFHMSHAVHWTTHGDKTPNSTLISTSRPFLFREIELVRPRAILALGRVALDALFGFRDNIGPVVGTTMRWQRGRHDIPVLVSWSPAYCLHVQGVQGDLENIVAEFATHYGIAAPAREAA